MHQRQSPEAAHPLIGRVRSHRHGLAVDEAEFVNGAIDRRRVIDQNSEPQRKGE